MRSPNKRDQAKRKVFFPCRFLFFIFASPLLRGAPPTIARQVPRELGAESRRLTARMLVGGRLNLIMMITRRRQKITRGGEVLLLRIIDIRRRRRRRRRRKRGSPLSSSRRGPGRRKKMLWSVMASMVGLCRSKDDGVVSQGRWAGRKLEQSSPGGVFMPPPEAREKDASRFSDASR